MTPANLLILADRVEGLSGDEPVRCHNCGRFIGQVALLTTAKHHFLPLNEFGPEESWWTCKRCEGAESPSIRAIAANQEKDCG